jgi:transketolase
MVGIAAGMASCGLRPWVFSFSAFLCCRAYDQIRTSVAHTNLPVTLVGSHAGGCGGRNGKSHLSLNDVAIMTSLPAMSVWSPASPRDAIFATDSALETAGPVYLRLPRTEVNEILPKGETAQWIGEPTPVSIISHGLGTQWAVEVRDELLRAGKSVGVLHFNKLWPLEHVLIVQLLSGVTTAISLEDHNVHGGLGSILVSMGLPCPLVRLGWPCSWSGSSGSDGALRTAAGIDLGSLVRTVRDANSKCRATHQI